MIRQDTSVTPAIKTAFRMLDGIGVLIPLPEKVGDYLAHHPDLIDPITKAARAARDLLGNHTQLSLEIYRDPEGDDCYPTLYVRQADYNDDIFALIDKVGTVYEPDLADKSGWFLVTTDLRPPV